MFNSGYSLADISAATGNNNNGMWGDGAWWIIILLLFGGRGWGGYGSGGSGAYDNYVLTSDFAQLDRKIEGVNNGICSLGYDQLAQMNGINTNILTSSNALQGAVKDCCCQTQQNIKDTQYAIATNANMVDRSIADGFCQTNYNMQTNTRDIIDSNTAGTQAIIAKLDAMENSRKDEKIAEQACIINNQYLLSQINKTPVPAYMVANPYCNCGYNGYGYYNGTTFA